MQQLITLDEQLTANFAALVASLPFISKIFIIIGVGFVYVIPFILLYVWFVHSRKIALRSALTGVLAWEGLSKLIAKLVERARPSESLIGTKELVFHRPDTSFPSDHSAFLMALTVAFYLSGQRKWGNLLLLMTVAVGIARVGIGVHFVGDILAGWLLGAVVAYLLKAIEQPLDEYVIEPLIKIAKRFRL